MAKTYTRTLVEKTKAMLLKLLIPKGRLEFWRSTPMCGTVKLPLAAGPIPDQTTALRVVEPELIRVYGANVIESEKPLNAGLLGDMWIVAGTFHCSDGKGGITTLCVGGVATAHLSKNDGRVLRISSFETTAERWPRRLLHRLGCSRAGTRG